MASFFDSIRNQLGSSSGKNNQGSSAQPVPSNVQQQSYNGIGNPQQGQSYNGIGGSPNGQSYNGIGAPPSGQSYNGIGAPPQGQSFNGIGNPGQVQQPQAQNQQQGTNQIPGTSPIPQDRTEAIKNSSRKLDSDQQHRKSKLDHIMQEEFADEASSSPDTKQNEPQQTQPTPDPTKVDQTGKIEENQNDGQKTSAEADSPDKKKMITPQASKRMNMDVMTHLTQRSNRVFVSATNKAKELNSDVIDTEHVLHGLLTDPDIYKMFTGMKVQPQTVDQELDKVYKKSEKPIDGQPQVSPRVKRILDNALVLARKIGYEFISPEHLLLSTYNEGEGVAARVLQKMGVDRAEVEKKIIGKKKEAEEKEAEKNKSPLEKFTIDLTQQAAEGKLDPCVGRSDVIERVVHILSRRLKNNPVLIGEPGVGKTAIVEGLAQKIVGKQVPESLLDKRILQLDLMSVVAGASHRGEFEQRMKELVEEVKEGKGQVILFIDEIHNIVGAGGGGEGSSDAANFLKPALSRGEMQMIGATTIAEYRKYIEKDAALERRFQTAMVPEPEEETAVKMLKALRDKFEAFHRVKIPDDALEEAVKLSKRYLGDRFLPDKAVDLMDESASAVRLPLISLPEEIKSLEERVSQLSQERDEAQKRKDRVRERILNSKIDDIQSDLQAKKDEYNMKKGQTNTAVSKNIVRQIIATRTGIPISKLSGSEKEKLINLEDIMHERMINQVRAVNAVAKSVRRGRAGLKSPNRPTGSFIFLGPSGVGKTELAKTLAEILFGVEESMIRFDMTEYMEKHEVAKLLGPPPGYVGYEEGGKLTEAVRRQQYSIVLFDEVEKAHPDIFNILLQILDDGRLTDNKGRTISFKNTVVICTSNIGTKLIQDDLMKGGKGEVEEPPVLSTYTLTPQGRELLTIGTKFFERTGNDQQGAWKDSMLFDYFGGQKVEMAPIEEGSEPPEILEEQLALPALGYDTHAISSQGMEVVTKDDLVYVRNSTTEKVWYITTLIEYFKGQRVVNAMEDAPDEQLPTIRFKTHTFTPDGNEVVSFRDRFWKKRGEDPEWETGTLKEYFLKDEIENGKLPENHWDIHAYAPTGKEIIIVGDKIWTKEPNTNKWNEQELKTYFGKEFPLEKEVADKQKNDSETDSKKYNIIKEKVKNELLKFFRPELVNRFDEVIVFEPLKFEHMLEIVKLQLKGLRKLLEDQEIGFSYSESARKQVVRDGFDPVFGARPLRRAIQKLLEDPISEMLIASQVKPGDIIYVDFDGENFIFDVERTEYVTEKKNSMQGYKGESGKNYTKLDIGKLIAARYPKEQETILQQLMKEFPEYEVVLKEAQQKQSQQSKSDTQGQDKQQPQGNNTSQDGRQEEDKNKQKSNSDQQNNLQQKSANQQKQNNQANGKPQQQNQNSTNQNKQQNSNGQAQSNLNQNAMSQQPSRNVIPPQNNGQAGVNQVTST